MAELIPVVGDWYRRPDGALFEVVAIDEHDRTIEVQHHDGTVEEIDNETWREIDLEPAEAPEDWGSGTFDIEKEDYAIDFDEEPKAAWSDPLDYFDSKD